MSDPFRDASASRSEDLKRQDRLDIFTNETLAHYLTEDDVDNLAKRRGLAPTQEEASQPETISKTTTKKSLKLNNTTDASKPKPPQSKAPAKAKATAHQSPVRKSSRSIAGNQRRAPEVSSDVEEPPSSPLVKKAKATKTMPAPASLSKPTATSSKLTKAATPASKPKDRTTRAFRAESQVTAPKTTAKTSKKRPRTPEQDDDDVSDAESDRPSKAKKTKKNKDGTVTEELKSFEEKGNSSGMGYSAERPDCGTLDEPWKCANRTCNTGMTWLKRGNGSGTDGYGRKVCSHFFGRNKTQTGYIHEEVWHWYCRKCYQREAYRAKNPKKREDDSDSGFEPTTKLHMERLRHQIARLQFWRPEMVFTVQLHQQAQKRLAIYHEALAKKLPEAEAVEAAEFVVGKTPKGRDSKPSTIWAFPIKHIAHINDYMKGKNKTYGDLIKICDWVDALNQAGEAPCDPPVEFLPSAATDTETIVDPVGPPDNYDQWADFCDDKAQEEASLSSEVDEADVKSEADDGDDQDADDELPEVEEAAGDFDSEDEVEDGDETEEDNAAPLVRKAPLWMPTELGKKVGLTPASTKVGIVKGSGIRSEREAEQRKREASEQSSERASATSEGPEIKVESED